MILPDVNLLVHAYNAESPAHGKARAWWEDLLNGTRPVGLAWVAMLGFLRITTHRQVLTRPWPVATACATVQGWLARPYVGVLHPGERHAGILFGLLGTLGTGGNLTTDAHLAALAIEHQCELHSTDADFGRFVGLRWANPWTDPLVEYVFGSVAQGHPTGPAGDSTVRTAARVGVPQLVKGVRQATS